MTADNFSRLPHEACLIPNLPEEIQHRVQDMANYVVQPLNMLLAIVAFVCNSFICITVARTKSLQRPSLLMLCSLSVTDLIQGMFAMYMSIKTVLSEHMCISYLDIKDYAMAILSNLATLGTLAVISRDRYLAVTKPWWYRNHVSKSRAIKMSCIPWTISVVITLAHVFNGGYKHLVHAIPLVYYCIGFIIIILSNLGIYFKKTPIAEIRDIQAVIKREKKSATTIRLILLVLLLTFLPALLFPIVLTVNGVEHFGPYRPFMSFLFTVGAFVNPLLNFGRSKDMRRAVRDLFSCSQDVTPPPPPASAPAAQPPRQQEQQQQEKQREQK